MLGDTGAQVASLQAKFVLASLQTVSPSPLLGSTSLPFSSVALVRASLGFPVRSLGSEVLTAGLEVSDLGPQVKDVRLKLGGVIFQVDCLVLVRGGACLPLRGSGLVLMCAGLGLVDLRVECGRAELVFGNGGLQFTDFCFEFVVDSLELGALSLCVGGEGLPIGHLRLVVVGLGLPVRHMVVSDSFSTCELVEEVVNLVIGTGELGLQLTNVNVSGIDDGLVVRNPRGQSAPVLVQPSNSPLVRTLVPLDLVLAFAGAGLLPLERGAGPAVRFDGGVEVGVEGIVALLEVRNIELVVLFAKVPIQ